MHIYLDSYLDNNLGDDLMIIGVANKFPKITFHIVTDNSVVSQHYKQYDNIEVHAPKDRKALFNKIDVYCKLGGSIFQIRSIKQIIIRYIWYIRMKRLKRKGVKFITMGCNTGPFCSSLAEKIASKEMNLCEFITVRDQESLRFVKETAGFSNVFMHDDIVFELLDGFDLKTKNHKKTNALKIGITAYRSANFKEKNWLLYNKVTEVLLKFARLYDRDIEIYLYSFDTENENDLSAAHHIQFLLNQNGLSSEIIPYLGNNIEFFLNHFQEMDKIIAIRFHGAILADYFDIPYLPIAYSNKLANYINDVTGTHSYLEIDDLKILDFSESNSIKPVTFINRKKSINSGHIKLLSEFISTFNDK